jgi:N,N'-diacetylchitobiose transport system substrate-binding protein
VASWNDDPSASTDDAVVPPRPAGPPTVEPSTVEPTAGDGTGGPGVRWSAPHEPAQSGATVPPPRPTYAPVAVPPPPQYPHVPPPPGWAPPPPPRAASRRRFLALGSAAAVVAAGGGAAAWLLTDRDGKPTARPGPTPPAPMPPPILETRSVPDVPLAETGPYTITMWAETVVTPGENDGWLRTDLPQALTKADEFGTLKVQLQEFADDAKLDTALAAGGSSAPDLFQSTTMALARHVARGALLDLTPYASRLNPDTWHPAIRAACTIDDKLYALPMDLNVPVVLYDKRLCDPAGFVVPRSRDEWLTQLDRLKAFHAADPKFQAIQLVGKSWQPLMAFLFENGSRIAVRDGDRWRGVLTEQPARDAIAFFAKLQGYSTAKKDAEDWIDPSGPSFLDAFSAGKTAMGIQPDWVYQEILRKYPATAEHLGAFALPGLTVGTPSAVGTWGSVIAASAKTAHPAGAVNLLRVLSTAAWQGRWADALEAAPAVVGVTNTKGAANPMRPATLAALKQARPFPQAPGWSGGPLKDYAVAVVTGKLDVVGAGVQADARIASDFPKSTR